MIPKSMEMKATKQDFQLIESTYKYRKAPISPLMKAWFDNKKDMLFNKELKRQTSELDKNSPLKSKILNKQEKDKLKKIFFDEETPDLNTETIQQIPLYFKPETTRSLDAFIYNFNLNFFNNFEYKKDFGSKSYKISLQWF